ncbi:MAG TPA: cell envelope integrity protein TolA [Acidiferrobacter sp.]|nr:cell envelope integrity protein TolA [Acidiferrobacter sp.]
MAPPPAPFSRALALAVALELLVLASYVAYRHFMLPVTVGLHRVPTIVHMVTLPEPRPTPALPLVRPHPRLRPPVHHPVPRPAPPMPPRPLPRRVVAPAPVAPRLLPPVNRITAAQAVDRYAVMLRTRIQTGLRVPGEVQALGLSGAATVAFELTPQGQLLWARLGRSSGLGPIDRACIAAVRARTYPPFTAAMPPHPMIFDVVVAMRQR